MPSSEKSLIKRLLQAIKAKDELLACYRLGKRPPERVWKALDAASKTVEEAEALVAKKE